MLSGSNRWAFYFVRAVTLDLSGMRGQGPRSDKTICAASAYPMVLPRIEGVVIHDLVKQIAVEYSSRVLVRI